MSVSDVLKDRESEGNSSRVSKVKCDGAHQAIAMEVLSLQRSSKLYHKTELLCGKTRLFHQVSSWLC